MKYQQITDEFLKTFERENELKKIMDEKRKIWEEEIKHTKTIDEYDATKPLFDEYLDAAEKYQRHLFDNIKKYLPNKL